MAVDYPWNSQYAFSENRVIDAIELEGLESFTVHGTTSTPAAFNLMTNNDIVLLTGNKTVDRGFEWNENTGLENGYFNNQADRKAAAVALSTYVIKHRKEGEDITLLAHSHGGNVSIQAVNLIREQLDQDEKTKDIKIHLVTMATPAYNGLVDPENPANAKVDSHTHFYSENDMVQKKLANLVGKKDAKRTYDNEKTKNIKVIDYKEKTVTTGRGMRKNTYNRKVYDRGGIGSHSIQERPELLKD